MVGENVLRVNIKFISLQKKMYWLQYFVPLLLSTFTAWAVIWAVIKILFHPRHPVRFFGITLQGIVPRKKTAMAKKLARAVETQFFSFDAIEKKLTAPDNFHQLKPEIEKHIDIFLKEKLKEVFPMLSMFIGDKTINQLKNAFLAELENIFPVIIKSYLSKIQEGFNMEEIIREKMNAVSIDTLERNFYMLAKRELCYAQWIAAIFGFLMGCLHIAVSCYLYQ